MRRASPASPGCRPLLGAGVTSYIAGDIILGGDGSDVIMGLAAMTSSTATNGSTCNIAVYAATDANRTGAPIALHNSMTELAQQMFSGAINPGQLAIVREIKTDTTAGDIDVAKFQGARGEYAFSRHRGRAGHRHARDRRLARRHRQAAQHRARSSSPTGNALNIIVGTPGNDVLNGTAEDDLILGLGGNDTLNGGAGNDILVRRPRQRHRRHDRQLQHRRPTATAMARVPFPGTWIETNDGRRPRPDGDIDINGDRLQLRPRTSTVARSSRAPSTSPARPRPR